MVGDHLVVLNTYPSFGYSGCPKRKGILRMDHRYDPSNFGPCLPHSVHVLARFMALYSKANARLQHCQSHFESSSIQMTANCKASTVKATMSS